MSENVTEFEQKINNIKVCLKTGNVAAEDADCIVVPEFRSGASGGGVGYAIEAAGMGAGLEAYEKVAKEGFLKDGDAILTKSGKPDVMLAHVVTVSAKEDSQLEVVNRSILKTLETANEMGLKRIALPEIGTGIIGSLTQEQSAKTIFNAVYEFSKNNPASSVEEVSFVVYRSSTEPAKKVLTEKSYIDIMTSEKGNKKLNLGEFLDGLQNNGVKKGKKSPTREEILNDKATREFGRNLVTKLFWAETREAVDAYIEAGIDINQKSRAENKTALDYCIGRVIKGINTYEDSDNKGAVLRMALKGGKCSAESLEQLKAKDPDFHSRVVGVMKMRERLQDLGAEIVTGTQYPQSGHISDRYQASGHSSEEIVQETLGRTREKINKKFMPNSPESSRPDRIGVARLDPDHDPRAEAMKKEWAKRVILGQKPLVIPDDMVAAMKDKNKPLQGLDEIPSVPTHEERHRKNTKEELLEKKERQDLLKDAITISRKQDGIAISTSELCKQVVEAAKTSPVKAEDYGYVFVVRKGADLSEVLSAWKEQDCKPWLKEEKEFTPEYLAKRLQEAEFTEFGTFVDSYQEAAIVELLVTEHPEHADKISMLQLLNAYYKSEYRSYASEKILKEFNNSAKRFAKGEETFPPTLENVVTFNEHRAKINFLLGGVFSYDTHKGGTLKADFERRIAETELKVLKSLKPEDLEYVSDKTLADGLRIAGKHKEAGNGDFGKIFTTELKRRLSRVNVFDPRDPKE